MHKAVAAMQLVVFFALTVLFLVFSSGVLS